MATISSKSVLGDVSGKIGPIIVSSWKKTGIVKSLPSSRKGGLSIKQQRQNELFAIVMVFLSKTRNLREIIKDGFQLPKKKKISEMNLATSHNMLNAFNDDGINYTLDLPKVKFSHSIRSTENGWNAQFLSNQKGLLELRWELNPFPEKSTNLDDLAVPIFYNRTQNIFLYVPRCSRSKLSCSFISNPNESGDEVFCWLFFISADGKLVSETEYLGVITT